MATKQRVAIKESLKRWKLLPNQEEVAQKLASHLNCSPVAAQLLLNRNIQSLTEAKHFMGLEPEPVQFETKQLETLLSYIQKSIDANRCILLYGDYDVDGMTSVSIMTKALTIMGAVVRYKIPHRFKDGYGLNHSVLDLVKESNCGLLLTLDCGITNNDEIAHIKANSDCDVVVIDHHQIPDPQPPADFILNPKEEGTHEALANLCTAGIAYKCVEFFQSKFPQIKLKEFIDLAALGTVADVVPLLHENRRIVREGLLALSNRKNKGIKQLLESANVDRPLISVRDVGFAIAPRLNAAGRLSTAEYGVKLLLSGTENDARDLASHLERLNTDRRQLDSQVLSEAIDMAEAQNPDNNILVLGKAGWHAGVIGITASKLVERYAKPVVMVGIDEGKARGSARTCGDVNIHALLKQCTQHLSNFGGHKQAAGFSLKPENFAPFKRHLEDIVKAQVSKEALYDTVYVDMALDPEQISDKLLDELDTLAPYGHSNADPLFYSDQFTIVDSKVVGNGSHLKLTVKGKNPHTVFDAIGFNLADRLPLVYNDKNHLLFNLGKNSWNGRESIQLVIKDIK